MVAISTIKESNKTLPSVLPAGLTAVFLGATSGIGKAALKQFVLATRDKAPHIYIVGRSLRAATAQIAELRQDNSSATIEFVQQDVSLVRNVDAAVNEIKQHERKVDFLFLSVGFISFQGRKETSEGLEPSMTTRFYSRARTIQLLLPLLNQSENAHVVNVLAAGMEAPLLEDDLDLAKPGNFSIAASSTQSTTMLTLLLEKFARENPNISFVHEYPGLVATPVLTRGSTGIVTFLMRYLVTPLLSLFATSADDAGARTLFYATNARYTVPEKANAAASIPKGLQRVQPSGGGVFLLNNKGEVADNEKVLADQRSRLTDKVWEHSQQIYARVNQ